MSVITIRDAATGLRAAVAVDRGFNCYQFTAVVDEKQTGERRVDVIAAEAGFENGAGQPSHNGIPILFPFPNRIRGGEYTWNGQEYRMPLSDGHPHTLHGFVYNRPWRVIEAGDDFVVGQFQLSVDAPEAVDHWPSDFVLTVRYTVQGAGLTMHVRVDNPGDVPLPWGFGTHAYFKLPLGEGSEKFDCLVKALAHEEWVLDECLPTGERRSVSANADLREGVSLEERSLDDVLTGLEAEDGQITTVISDPKSDLRVTQSFSEEFRELVVFTPPWTDAVCMEPYTCVTDAINLQQQGIDAGWRTLPPGRSWETEIVIRVTGNES